MTIIKTSNGYMIITESGEYLEDSQGNNCFETYAEAQALI